MNEIKILEKNSAEEEPTTTKLELLKFTTQVADDTLIKNVTSDFVLAKLADKDKEAVVEMLHNAYFARRVIDKCATHQRWKWDDAQKEWYKSPLTDREVHYIRTNAQATFDTFMTRLKTIAIVNRNVSNNWLLRLVTGYQEEEGETIGTGDEASKMEVMKAYINEKINKEVK